MIDITLLPILSPGKSVDIRSIDDLMGRSNINTTAIYAKVIAEGAAKAVSK
jgi:site-specific recombinase XerD